MAYKFESMKKLALYVTLFCAAAAQAEPIPLNVASMTDSACLAQVDESEPADILSSMGISVFGAESWELSPIASAFKSIYERGDGRLTKSFKNIRIRIKDMVFGSTLRKGKRAQLAGFQVDSHTYQFSREILEYGADGTTYMVHELGHFVGHSDSNYQKYNSFVSEVCQMTVYCTHRIAHGFENVPHKNRNEEFAEAFAAYIVKPSLLLNACPKAYEFFENKIFNSEKNQQNQFLPRLTNSRVQSFQCTYRIEDPLCRP